MEWAEHAGAHMLLYRYIFFLLPGLVLVSWREVIYVHRKEKLMRCSQCRVAKYCGAKCQVRTSAVSEACLQVLQLVCPPLSLWPRSASAQPLPYFSLFYFSLKYYMCIAKSYIGYTHTHTHAHTSRQTIKLLLLSILYPPDLNSFPEMTTVKCLCSIFWVNIVIYLYPLFYFF